MTIEERFCEHCFNSNELIETVRENGVEIDRCLVCGKTHSFALPANDPLLKRIFRAVIRLHYSEWEYNDHVGGESLSSILFGENAIMALKESASAEEFENAFSYIEDEWYPDPDDGISLGGGYWDGHILFGVRARLSSQLTSLLKRSFTDNYYSLQKDLANILEGIRPDIEDNFPKGAELFRARIGVNKRLTSAGNFENYYSYVAHSESDIGCPPIFAASEGRLNRARVSLLYLASDRKTAVAEIRPHPGHLVSTAQFKSKQDLKIVDLTDKDIRNFLSDSRLDQLHLIFSFNSLMNLPVTPDRKEYYIITQLISDSIREAGFDGVKFKSSLGHGDNFTFFNPGDFELIAGSEAVVAVKALSYQIAKVPTVPKDYDDLEYEVDEDNPLFTLLADLERHR